MWSEKEKRTRRKGVCRMWRGKVYQTRRVNVERDPVLVCPYVRPCEIRFVLVSLLSWKR
jgi:hypothetical protein